MKNHGACSISAVGGAELHSKRVTSHAPSVLLEREKGQQGSRVLEKQEALLEGTRWVSLQLPAAGIGCREGKGTNLLAIQAKPVFARAPQGVSSGAVLTPCICSCAGRSHLLWDPSSDSAMQVPQSLKNIIPGQSEPDVTDEVCAMCPSLTYQQVRRRTAVEDGPASLVP